MSLLHDECCPLPLAGLPIVGLDLETRLRAHSIVRRELMEDGEEGLPMLVGGPSVRQSRLRQITACSYASAADGTSARKVRRSGSPGSARAGRLGGDGAVRTASGSVVRSASAPSRMRRHASAA